VFTVDKVVNAESGEEVSTMSFDNTQPQTDDNYITQEEWDELEQQNQDLIEKFEDSQTNGGGAGGFVDGGNSTLLAALAAVAGGAVLFGGRRE